MKGISECANDLDCSIISSQLGLLEYPTSKTHQESQESMISSVNDLSQNLSSLIEESKSLNIMGVGKSKTNSLFIFFFPIYFIF